MIFVFHVDRFDFDFWGKLSHAKLGDIETQIKNSMLVTLWAFIGIEGAVVLSGRAKSQSDVGKATVMGFLGCLSIYVLLSILPFGFMTQARLAGIANPSTAGVLRAVVGCVVDEHRPADCRAGKLAQLDDDYSANATIYGTKWNVSCKVCQRK